jgi:hypothetical protein
MKKILVAFLVVVALTFTGCGKMTEPFKDAERGSTNDGPADTITFPDGFSNAATKCDNGNRVYVLYHGDSAYGSIAVVPNDPTCSSGSDFE